MIRTLLFLGCLFYFVLPSKNQNNKSLAAPACPLDSLALKTLYASTGGEQWSIKWDLAMPMSNWYGVRLNANGCVDGLFLSDNNLTGTLPIEIGDLSELTHLDIGFNLLRGNIPSEIRNLMNLKFFKADNNNLTGTIPSSIKTLVHLTYFVIGFNDISGSIPKEIGDLSSLEYFVADSNRLEGSIPEEIGQLSNLLELDISQNNLTGGIPSTIGNLSKLVQLELYLNKLSGSIPVALGNLSKLEGLYFWNNQLSGCFPDTLLIFCNLDYSDIFGVRGYNFKNNPGLPWFGDFKRYCDGVDPQISATCDDANTSTIDDSINDLCQCLGTFACRYTDSLALVQLYEATNGSNWIHKWNLLQPIDSWWGVYIDVNGCVTCLDLDGIDDCITSSTGTGNGLNGLLPDLNLPKLELLHLSNNKLLKDPIPDFSYLENLSDLVLVNCGFEDSIPNFSKLPSIDKIDLSGNNLTGTIPDFMHLNTLRSLRLWSNDLQGEIPSFSNLSDLTEFICYNNNLEGVIPDFSDNPNLQRISLYKNQLSAAAPLNNLLNLQQLKIYNNNLTFDDIIPNVGVAVDTFEYAPQDSIFKDTTITLKAGATLLIDLNIDNSLSSNQYHWLKDGNPLILLDSNKLEIKNIQKPMEGTYSCQVSNEDAPYLTLYSRAIRVFIEPNHNPVLPSGLPEKYNPLLTPNGDTRNDVLSFEGVIDLSQYPENSISIFNRYGNKIYSAAAYNNDWTGTYNGKTLPDGTYFYLLKLGENDSLTGYITLLTTRQR